MTDEGLPPGAERRTAPLTMSAEQEASDRDLAVTGSGTVPVWESMQMRKDAIARAWAEIDALRARAVLPEPTIEEWLRMNGVGNLTGAPAALANWSEPVEDDDGFWSTTRQTNHGPETVIHDGTAYSCREIPEIEVWAVLRIMAAKSQSARLPSQPQGGMSEPVLIVQDPKPPCAEHSWVADAATPDSVWCAKCGVRYTEWAAAVEQEVALLTDPVKPLTMTEAAYRSSRELARSYYDSPTGFDVSGKQFWEAWQEIAALSHRVAALEAELTLYRERLDFAIREHPHIIYDVKDHRYYGTGRNLIVSGKHLSGLEVLDELMAAAKVEGK